MRMRCVTKNRAYLSRIYLLRVCGPLFLLTLGAGTAHAYERTSAPEGFIVSKTCLTFQNESIGSAPAVYTTAETASPAFVLGLRFAFGSGGDHHAPLTPHMAFWSPGGATALAMADSKACAN